MNVLPVMSSSPRNANDRTFNDKAQLSADPWNAIWSINVASNKSNATSGRCASCCCNAIVRVTLKSDRKSVE
jgi:hypothetical protein